MLLRPGQIQPPLTKSCEGLGDGLQGLNRMEFEWDEKKRISTIEKRGFDLQDASKVFIGLHITITAHSFFEPREIAIGMLHEKLVAVIFTRRGERLRLITVRRARENERRAYRAIHT